MWLFSSPFSILYLILLFSILPFYGSCHNIFLGSILLWVLSLGVDSGKAKRGDDVNLSAGTGDTLPFTSTLLPPPDLPTLPYSHLPPPPSSPPPPPHPQLHSLTISSPSSPTSTPSSPITSPLLPHLPSPSPLHPHPPLTGRRSSEVVCGCFNNLVLGKPHLKMIVLDSRACPPTQVAMDKMPWTRTCNSGRLGASIIKARELYVVTLHLNDQNQVMQGAVVVKVEFVTWNSCVYDPLGLTIIVWLPPLVWVWDAALSVSQAIGATIVKGHVKLASTLSLLRMENGCSSELPGRSTGRRNIVMLVNKEHGDNGGRSEGPRARVGAT
ncbi:hypothetical protein C7M84_023483 [Penaeus vannamei]|uniref:Uncharacterized protein n=1 Tax=Penaeus vannamei TaxID=6689 RepID=A0A3R7MJF7_PENVA|nr:hypothetical protein C7M84_023483 [Penaeus vannamei]